MASLNVAVTLRLRSTPVAPAAGVVAVMAGAGPVVNVHVLVVIVLPARSRIPERVAVYTRSANSVAFGFSVATLVSAL